MPTAPTHVDEIVALLKETLTDGVLSKSEKRSIKALVAEYGLDQDQLNFLRSQMYELAHANASGQNFRFIMDWIKETNSAFLSKPVLQKAGAFFSPGEGCRQVIIHQIRQAVSRIKICVFTISDDLITNAIIATHRRGVDIRIITDNDKSLDLGSDIAQLSQEGITIRMDNTSNHMHHKFMIVDDRSLINGSYNWTRSAAQFNHENVVLTSEVSLVKDFLKQFELLWTEMSSYGRS